MFLKEYAEENLIWLISIHEDQNLVSVLLITVFHILETIISFF